MQAYGEAKKLNTLTTSFAKLPRIGTIKYAEALLCSAQILSYMAQQTTVPSFSLKTRTEIQIKHHQYMKEDTLKS